MSSPLALAALATLVSGVAGALAVRARPRAGARVRPYRRAGGAARDLEAGATWVPARTSPWRRFVSSVSARRGDRLSEMLRAAGLDPRAADGYRVRQLAHTAGGAGAGAVLGGALLRSPGLTVAFVAVGAAVGHTRAPARLARLAEVRRVTMRLELVTIDQVLAIHVRAGAGPVQAVTRVVDRGSGVVVDELRGVLAAIRAGRGEADAFRHAASTTVEPHAARTYRLFALASEQGADLGTALRALSDDLRDVRRDELRRQATRRRAAMLVPTIAVLAPIMLLFVIAPLPSLVLGGR